MPQVKVGDFGMSRFVGVEDNGAILAIAPRTQTS
jgi:hypothetical protein